HLASGTNEVFMTHDTYIHFSFSIGGVIRITPDGTASNVVTNMLVPGGITLGRTGSLSSTLWVSESSINPRVFSVNLSSGKQTVVAGSGTGGFSGDGGLATKAMLAGPMGLAWQPEGLYIADSGNKRIRRVAASNDTFEPQLATHL